MRWQKEDEDDDCQNLCVCLILKKLSCFACKWCSAQGFLDNTARKRQGRLISIKLMGAVGLSIIKRLTWAGTHVLLMNRKGVYTYENSFVVCTQHSKLNEKGLQWIYDLPQLNQIRLLNCIIPRTVVCCNDHYATFFITSYFLSTQLYLILCIVVAL